MPSSFCYSRLVGDIGESPPSASAYFRFNPASRVAKEARIFATPAKGLSIPHVATGVETPMFFTPPG